MNDPSFFKVNAAGTFNKLTDLIGGTNMAAVALSRAPRLIVLRLHLGGGLRDHSRGGRRAYLVGGVGDQPRSLCLGHRERPHDREARSQYLQDLGGDRRNHRDLPRLCLEKQNVAFMVGLAFAVAASCNSPSCSCR